MARLGLMPPEKDDALDPGDKLSCGIGFKKGLPNYSSIDVHVSISVTKREGETDEAFALRGWASAEAELVREVQSQGELLEQIRPVAGDPGAWD